MSTEVYPVLPGLGFSVKRTPQFKSRIQQSVSGKESRIADWTSPRYTYELTYEILREHGSFQELKEIAAFWLRRQGSFDTFLFDDPDDDAVTGQGIGTGDAVTTVYQLLRSFGASGHPTWTDTILAPNVISNVYLNGAPTSAYTYTSWGDDFPGQLTFVSAPGSGVVITADFTYYWPCRFVEDTIEFEKFMSLMWTAKTVKLISIK